MEVENLKIVRCRAAFVGILASVTLLSSCGDSTQIPESVPPSAAITVGDVFNTSCLKIKADLTDTSVSPNRTATIELYVDSEGDGQGLLGFGDTVCDVFVSGNNLYILVDGSNAILISDLSGRLILTSANITSAADLVPYGFVVQDGIPVEYQAREGTLVVDTVFAQSTNSFDAVGVVPSNTMTFTECLEYIADYNTNKLVEVGQEEPAKEVVDFYNSSVYGVNIEGTVYSIGDTCNPSTYFRGATPEGLVTSFEYREDTRVDFLHVSYLSPVGRTVFTTVDNYVQAIQSSADFTFLEFSRGDDFKAIQSVLGIRLSRDEQAAFKPIDENIVVVSSDSRTYVLTIDDLKVEFRSTKGQTLDEIYIEQSLDFRS